MQFASVIDIFVKTPQIIHNYTSLFYFRFTALSRKNSGCEDIAFRCFYIIYNVAIPVCRHRSNAGASMRYFSKLDEKCQVMKPPYRPASCSPRISAPTSSGPYGLYGYLIAS